MSRGEDAQGAGVSKEAVSVDRSSNNSVDLRDWSAAEKDPESTHDSYRLALKGPPHDRSVSHGELGQAAAREDTTLGDIEGVHDGDNEVVASAGSLHILQQLGGDQLMHVSTEVGGVQRNMTRQVVEEEHLGDCFAGDLGFESRQSRSRVGSWGLEWVFDVADLRVRSSSWWACWNWQQCQGRRRVVLRAFAIDCKE